MIQEKAGSVPALSTAELGAIGSKRAHLTGMKLLFTAYQVQVIVQEVFISKLRFYNQTGF